MVKSSSRIPISFNERASLWSLRYTLFFSVYEAFITDNESFRLGVSMPPNSSIVWKKDALDEEQPDGFTEEEHYWTPYRPYQQNVPNMETDAVKNTTDTVNPDCCTDIDVTDTANNKSPVSLKKDSAAEVSQEDASSQTTNSES